MSHLIYTKLGSDIRLCHVVDELKARGMETYVKMSDEGTIFYVPHKSFRGIFFTVEKDGKYDGYFKLNIGANRTDLVLFANLLDAFRITHGAKLFDEYEDYQEFDDPVWIKPSTISSLFQEKSSTGCLSGRKNIR